jgi:hypothetical protein
MALDWNALPPAKVLICSPCYGGLVYEAYMNSVLQLLEASAGSNVRFGVLTLPGDSLVARARNTCVAKFLSEDDWTHLFFLDADIAFDPKQVYRLLEKNEDVVCGVYPFKNYYFNNVSRMRDGMQDHDLRLLLMHYVFNPLPAKPGDPLPADGYVKVFDAATGFMMIKRRVFDVMREKYPHMKYRSDMPAHKGSPVEDHFWLFFDTGVDEDAGPENRRYLSEDYAFCRRWQAAGGQIWVDYNSALTHIGPHYFQGNLRGTMFQHQAFQMSGGGPLTDGVPVA